MKSSSSSGAPSLAPGAISATKYTVSSVPTTAPAAVAKANSSASNISSTYARGVSGGGGNNNNMGTDNNNDGDLLMYGADGGEGNNTGNNSDICVALFYVLFGGLWFAWIVIVLILLIQDSSLDANGQCGYLWEFMLVRTACFGIEFLQKLLEKCILDDEAGRACLGISSSRDLSLFPHPSSSSYGGGASEPHQALLPQQPGGGGWQEDDGCFELVAGQSPLMRSIGFFVRFVYNGGFVIAALLIVPNALMDHAPCCLKAMSSNSFTGTYTLAVFAWAYLVLDCMTTAIYAMALLYRGSSMQVVLPTYT